MPSSSVRKAREYGYRVESPGHLQLTAENHRPVSPVVFIREKAIEKELAELNVE